VVIALTSELIVGQSVPELDSLVGSGGDDLSVVRGEGDSENFLGVSVELLSGYTGS